MSIAITDSTSAVVVSYYNDKGTPNVETLTIPATGEYGEHTITIPVAAEAKVETVTFTVAAEAQVETVTIPATAGATQADYMVISDTLGTTFAVWFDIDAAGTAPTGAAYVAADEKIEVDIIAGGLAIGNAGLVKAAIELNANWDNATIVDNADGTLTITQNARAACDNIALHNADDSGAGSITNSVGNEGVTGSQQADYFVVSDALGNKFAVWLDVDAAGTAPTGAAYVAAVEQIEVNIVSGGTAIANAGLVKAAIELNESWVNATIVDNGNGTLTITQTVKAACDNVAVHNADDSGVGSITATVGNEGVTGALQGDYFVIASVDAATNTAVWFDVDADGTPPTGIFYTNSDYQVEVDIAAGGSAITNAAAVVTALGLEAGFTGVTVTDVLDGTITTKQDVVGWAGDFAFKNADDSGAGSVVVVTDNEGLAGITQGDYVVVENAYGVPIGIWFDVDNDETSPSGAAFIAAAGDGSTLEIDIATGDTNVENAANVAAALDPLAWANPMAVTDNEDGTITLTHTVGGTIAAPDPHNIDDTGLGAITATVDTLGAAKKLTRQDSWTKGSFSIIADLNRNILVFNKNATLSVGHKGADSTAFEYADVTVPTSTSLLNLKSQIDVFNVVTASAIAGVVVGEEAKAAEMTGANATFTTTYPFVYHSIEVFFNQLKMTLNTDYTEDGAAGEIVFASITPDNTLPTPDVLTFNYIKL